MHHAVAREFPMTAEAELRGRGHPPCALHRRIQVVALLADVVDTVVLLVVLLRVEVMMLRQMSLIITYLALPPHHPFHPRKLVLRTLPQQ